jgi:hypothetical protein
VAFAAEALTRWLWQIFAGHSVDIWVKQVDILPCLPETVFEALLGLGAIGKDVA